MLHLRRDLVPVMQFEAELPDHRHAALALARAIGISILVVAALAMFAFGAFALGTVLL